MELRGARARDERGSECDRQNGDVAEPLEPALDRVRADVLDDRRLIRAVAAGRRRGERPAFRRAELRWVDLSGGRRLQVVTYDERFTSVLADGDDARAAAHLLQDYLRWLTATG